VVRHRCGLSGLSGVAAPAARLRVPAMWARRRVGGRRRRVQVRVLCRPHIGHGGDDVRSPQDAADGVVRGLLDDLSGERIKPLRVGASVGAGCSRRPGIDRYWATVTAPDRVLRQHGARDADTQRNSPPLVTDQLITAAKKLDSN
jgi:hypothetical protein